MEIDFCVLSNWLLCLIAQVMLSRENFGSLCQDLKHVFVLVVRSTHNSSNIDFMISSKTLVVVHHSCPPFAVFTDNQNGHSFSSFIQMPQHELLSYIHFGARSFVRICGIALLARSTTCCRTVRLVGPVGRLFLMLMLNSVQDMECNLHISIKLWTHMHHCWLHMKSLTMMTP